MKYIAVLGVIVVSFGLVGRAAAQKPLYWEAPTWFEVNVPYSAALPVGQVTLGCAVDNYTNDVNWGDGTTSHLTTPGAAYKIYYNGQWITLVGPGTFTLYEAADKTFGAGSTSNPLNGELMSTLHCLNGTETEHWQTPVTLNVRPRTPLKEMELAISPSMKARGDSRAVPSIQVKGGSGVQVTIFATDKATLAKIHINLTWTDLSGVMLSPPTSVDVPYDNFAASFVVGTKKTNKTRQVKVQASTDGTPITGNISVTP